MVKDYYKILGVSRNASAQDIRKAYINHAKKVHPDVNKRPNAKATFQPISEAYEVLSNPTRKKVYDKGGEEALTAGGKRTVLNPSIDKRLASQFFGYGIAGLHPQTGEPLGSKNIPEKNGIPGFNLVGMSGSESTEDGVQKTTYSRKEKQKVKPSPVRPTKRPLLVELRCTLEELFYGAEKTATWDSYINGEYVTKEVDLDVEAGWKAAHLIKDIEDEDNDITIVVTEEKHSQFRREKDDLYYDCSLNLRQALCGEEIVIPTICKNKNLKLKFNGTVNDGYTHEIEGYGMPIHGKGGRGKMIVKFSIVLPTKITDKQRDGIRKILKN